MGHAGIITMNDIGFVAIGRNEGERLISSLSALLTWGSRVIYVDSGSTDGSQHRARALGLRVIELDASSPYTASRGRQAGVEAIRQLFPEVKFIQFVDGDCVLHPGWPEVATRYLLENARVGAVCGILREERESHSFYSRMIQVDWDLPTGEIPVFGGIVMIRLAALDQVGGWRPELAAGEEPDLSFRLSDACWTLVGLPVEMAVHDIEMTSFRQYWRRFIRSGYAYAAVGCLNVRGAGRRWVFLTIKNLVYGALFPLAAALSLIWFRPIAAAVAAFYGLLAVKMVYQRLRRGDPLATAFPYALLTVISKGALAWGALRYFAARWMSRPGRH
jgi:glycosyltransferase involved in cell wall biosynthesis